MSDPNAEVTLLQAQVAELQRGIRQLHVQFAITHHLVIALAKQCNSPEILRLNFHEIAEKSRDRLLYSPITDEDIAELKRIQELVGRQID